MKKLRNSFVLAAFLSFFVPQLILAEVPTRSIHLTASWVGLTGDAFSSGNGMGFGVSGSYEFHLSERFRLGVPLQFRHFPGTVALNQLGYGLTFRHFLGEEFFVGYGLLVNLSMRQGVDGSGMAHNTKLGLGWEGQVFGTPVTIEAAYHLSHLRYFGTPAVSLSFMEIGVGWNYFW